MKETLFRLVEKTKQPGVCSASSCRAPLDWYRTLTGASMPMNRGAVARDHVEDGRGGTVALFSSADAHWSTCPARQKFARRR
jgi:hypothetical protein